jgi:hypothetical protein
MEPAPLAYVLDTTAVLAYLRGTGGIGPMLSSTADKGEQVVLPALCLADAYRQADAEAAAMLDVMRDLPQIVVTPVDQGDCAVLGGWTGLVGRLDLAHAMIHAAAAHVPLVTADRELAVRILPEEWPIIDV